MTPPPANPLLADLAAGRAEAFAALYDRLGKPLFRVAKTILRDAADAEDAVHDVFADLARQRHRLAAVLDLDAYVFAMLRHAASRQLSRRKIELRHLQRIPIEIGESSVISADEDLQIALAGLPIGQREIISLKIDGGLTFAQIAEILRISPNTAASRYRYALEKLRRTLE